MQRAVFITALIVSALGAPAAHAHFLFVQIGPPAEAGRAAEVYFSEMATAGDPTFIDKIAHTKLWLQASPGDFKPLTLRKGVDRLRAALPAAGSVVVVGQCQCGVIAREKQTPFLLRYFPKAVAGKPDELNKLKPHPDSPLEIVATFAGDEITLVALRGGKPLPGAVFTTVDVELANEELSAGPDGRATWRPPSPGRYSVYTRFVTKTAGDVDGKKYEEIREFATLVFNWPLERRGPDAAAVALFEEALTARATWRSFPGFTAALTGEVDGRPFDGSVTVAADGSVNFKIQETVVESWDLPSSHTVTTASDAGLSVRGFTLSKHELLGAGPR